MSSESLIDKPLEAKQYEYKAYGAECPYCGDAFNADYSMVGDILECACGKKVKIVE